MTTQDDRAAFETWWKLERELLMLPVYVKEDDWISWQAALAHERQLKPVQADDLIRRSDAEEACLRATPDKEKLHFLGDAAHYIACKEAINTLPSFSNEQNKSAVEPVAYIDEYLNIEKHLHQWMIDEPNVNWFPVYLSANQQTITTPPQSQAVKDAYEAAAKIAETCADQAHTLGNSEEFRDCAARVRTLITNH